MTGPIADLSSSGGIGTSSLCHRHSVPLVQERVTPDHDMT